MTALEYFLLHTQTENGYTESGAGYLDLSVKKNNCILLLNELGLNFAICLCKKAGKFIFSPKISWVREVRLHGATAVATFAEEDVYFTTTGYFPDRSLVSPGFSFTSLLYDDLLSIELYYDGKFKGNYSDHIYGGMIRFGF
jgi:hypothetical protein